MDDCIYCKQADILVNKMRLPKDLCDIIRSFNSYTQYRDVIKIENGKAVVKGSYQTKVLTYGFQHTGHDCRMVYTVPRRYVRTIIPDYEADEGTDFLDMVIDINVIHTPRVVRRRLE